MCSLSVHFVVYGNDHCRYLVCLFALPGFMPCFCHLTVWNEPQANNPKAFHNERFSMIYAPISQSLASLAKRLLFEWYSETEPSLFRPEELASQELPPGIRSTVVPWYPQRICSRTPKSSHSYTLSQPYKDQGQERKNSRANWFPYTWGHTPVKMQKPSRAVRRQEPHFPLWLHTARLVGIRGGRKQCRCLEQTPSGRLHCGSTGCRVKGRHYKGQFGWKFRDTGKKATWGRRQRLW